MEGPSRIQEILQLRTSMAQYDTELWRFANMEQRNLQNLTAAELQLRLIEIDKNIQFLDDGSTPRDELRPERGWISPWWWLRQRYWTLLEFEQRKLMPGPPPSVPAMPQLAPEFLGVIAGGRKLLVRISEREWLLQILRGTMRFAAAGAYLNDKLGEARTDDEMKKAYKRPGQAIRITTESGELLKTIGDVESSMARRDDRPYWFCSFSSDLDPRLAMEFSSSDPAFLVVFDPMAMVKRILPSLNRAAPRALKELFPSEYFDPYFPPREKLRPHVDKEFQYAYQREMRLVLDPMDGMPLTNGAPLFIETHGITDIAGVYTPDGNNIAGAGPRSFLA